MLTDAVTTLDTTLSKDSVSIVLKGYCKLCGWCCVKMCTDNCMTDDGACRYLDKENEDGQRLCLIQKAVEANDTAYLDKLSKEVKDYWERYCKSFPSSINLDGDLSKTVADLLALGWPPDGCGFTLTEG